MCVILNFDLDVYLGHLIFDSGFKLISIQYTIVHNSCNISLFLHSDTESTQYV